MLHFLMLSNSFLFFLPFYVTRMEKRAVSKQQGEKSGLP